MSSSNNSAAFQHSSSYELESRASSSLQDTLLPVLQAQEVWDGHSDLRHHLPPEIQSYLAPYEKVIYIHHPGTPKPEQPLLARDVMDMALSGDGSIMASVDPLGGKSRYQYEHGRDAMKAASDIYGLQPERLKQVLLSLASSQGVEHEVYREGRLYGFEEPGSIILINRPAEDLMARKFEKLKGWPAPYFYGSVDAPVSFVNNIAQVHADEPSFLWRGYTDKNGIPRLMADAFKLSVRWIVDRIDESPDGFVEYSNPVTNGGGMRNQGWQDSAHAMVHADGSWANSKDGIAVLEVQAMAFDALMNAARLYETVFDDGKAAAELWERAYTLQADTIDKFWVESPEGGYLAPGRDRDANGLSRNMEVRKSSMGWVLATGLLKGDNPDHKARVRQLIKTLTAPDMLTRHGIRTLSSRSAAYTPFGYHTGSEWGQDLEVIAQGMSNHGYYGLDRMLGERSTRKHLSTGVFYEHTSSYDSVGVHVPERDTYVYNPLYDEVYMLEQVPPVAQTWEASAELGRAHRYSQIPQKAITATKRAFEKSILESVL